MDLGAIARGADVMEHIFAVLEDLPAVKEFPEKCATAVVLIAGQLDMEWEGLR